MSVDKEEAKRLDWILSSAVDVPYKLTTWENNFISSVTDHREEEGNDINISGKMWEILERIMKKVP